MPTMQEDLSEIVALAVSIANLVLTGQQSADPRVVQEARLKLDAAFGMLVNP